MRMADACFPLSLMQRRFAFPDLPKLRASGPGSLLGKRWHPQLRCICELAVAMLAAPEGTLIQSAAALQGAWANNQWCLGQLQQAQHDYGALESVPMQLMAALQGAWAGGCREPEQPQQAQRHPSG